MNRFQSLSLPKMKDKSDEVETRKSVFEILSALNSVVDGKQDLNANLTSLANLSSIINLLQIAGLTLSNDDILQEKNGVLTNRTMAQLGTDLVTSGTWTPTVTPETGSFTGSVLSAIYYQGLNNMVDLAVLYQITSTGTGGGFIRVTLPFLASGRWNGEAFCPSNFYCFGNVDAGTNELLFKKADLTSPIVADFYLISLRYRRT